MKGRKLLHPFSKYIGLIDGVPVDAQETASSLGII
jgi:hypothetical protein